MRDKILFILFICFCQFTFGQIHEIGGFIGASNFIGDVGKTNYWYPNALGGGIVYKYNINPRIALRGNITHIKIEGNDKTSGNPYRLERNNKFSNSINEIAVGSEYNFFQYNINDYNKAYTPYILTQIALINYEKPQSYNKGTLMTKSTTSYALPVGVGFKGRLAEKLAFAIEAGIRFTIKDDLDFTTPEIPELDFGGQGNDHYVFTGFSIVYTFGRPPCFAELQY